MPYYITGSLTFGSQANRDSARTALLAVALGAAAGWAGGPYPAGHTNSGTTALTISFSVAGEVAARALEAAFVTAYTPFPRTAGHLSTVKVGA